MKILIPNRCPICHDGGEVQFKRYDNDGKFETVCANGHRTVQHTQNHRWEVLFEFGAYAILDAYHREAITCFSAALERFYEFALQVLASELPNEVYKALWDNVKTLSERQLGAFMFVWAYRFKAIPKVLSPDDAGKRNKAVHQGVIPTEEEAIKFGELVFSIIRENMATLEANMNVHSRIADMAAEKYFTETLQGDPDPELTHITMTMNTIAGRKDTDFRTALRLLASSPMRDSR